MKKTLFLLQMIFWVTLISCSDDEPQTFIPDEKHDLIKPSDLKGVWKIGDKDSFYFIQFDGYNEYAFCLNNELMGAGYYTVTENKLSLKNQYLKFTDVLEISLDQNELKAKGDLTMFNGFSLESINLTFYKSGDKLPESIIGKQWHSGWILAQPTDYKEYVEFISEYVAQHYSIRDNYKNERFNEYKMYYIYCNGLTYTQKIDGSGNVNIYDLSFNGFYTLGNSLSENKVN